MIPGNDTAASLLALYTAIGDVTTLNAVGTVTAAAITVPDPVSGSTGAYNSYTLSHAGIVITLPTPSQGKRFRVSLKQDATGSRTVSWTTPSGAVQWTGKAAPTLTTTASDTDIVTFESYDGVNWVGTTLLNVG